MLLLEWLSSHRLVTFLFGENAFLALQLGPSLNHRVTEGHLPGKQRRLFRAVHFLTGHMLSLLFKETIHSHSAN